MENQESEVKYYIADLPALERRLQALGAQVKAPRVFEINLRFDTPENTLAGNAQVLRLRQDTRARLTFKGPARSDQGVRVRQEIEFEVSDFEKARAFLEALGYQVAMNYEKYRTTYELDEVEIVLDELPYGSFCELEGPNPAAIQAVSRRLELNWERRAPESYVYLFDQLKRAKNLPFRDLDFKSFENYQVTPEDLGLQPADR